MAVLHTHTHLILGHIPINSLPDVTKFILYLVTTGIREGDFSYAWKFVVKHFSNGSSQIQGIGFDQSYNPVAYSDSLRIYISVTDMHRLTSKMLDVSRDFQNKNVPIHERVCVIPPPNYLDCFQKSYPNITLNCDSGTFSLQCMNVIQGTKPTG